MLERATPLGIGRTGQPGRRGTIRQRSAIGKDDRWPGGGRSLPRGRRPTSSQSNPHAFPRNFKPCPQARATGLAYPRQDNTQPATKVKSMSWHSPARAARRHQLRLAPADRRLRCGDRLAAILSALIERDARYRALRQPEKLDDALLRDIESYPGRRPPPALSSCLHAARQRHSSRRPGSGRLCSYH